MGDLLWPTMMVAFIKSFRLAGKKEKGLAFEVQGLRLCSDIIKFSEKI